MNDPILSNYEIRKSNKEKTAFIDYLKDRLSAAGYDPEKHISVESSGKGLFKTRNIVVGNPDTAKVFITAHYDTCAVLPFPNIMCPTNPILFMVCQIFVAIALILIACLITLPVALISRNPMISYFTFLISFYLILFHVLFGYKNKHTANDNTSGVITITKILEALPAEHREKVCAVYFDNEEKGLFGSSNFSQKHKKKANNQLLINFDCVGDGNYISSFAKPKAMKDKNYKLLIESLNKYTENTDIHNLNKRVLPMMFPSDQIYFKKGIGFCALKKSIFGLYTARIHTPFDTCCSGENIEYLTNSITDFIGKL